MLESKSTRRRFLQVAGAGILATVGGGVLKLSRTEASSAGIWAKSADVVVIGTGAAGAAAAIQAADGGASVLLFERMGNFGGSSRNSGGTIYLGGGTPLQKALGFDDTPELMYEYLVAALGHGGDKNLLRAYADGSVDLYNWLVDLGVPFKEEFVPGKVVLGDGDYGLQYSGNELNYPYSEIIPPMPRGHKVQAPGSSGHVLMSVLEQNVRRRGVDVNYESMAKRLIVSEDRVIGIEVEMNGEVHRIRANKAVVLATGGFQFNREMLETYAPEYLNALAPLGMPGEDGSGIQMAQAIGADVNNMAFASPWSFVYPPDAMLKSVLISPQGLRFINEDRYGADVADAVLRNFGGTSYLILDQQIMDELGDHAKTVHTIAQADSIGELAKKLDVPVEIAENTMAFYNEHAAQGRDLLYGKHSDYVQPLEKAPYYAVDWSGNRAVFITLGGLRIDENARVKDVYGDPIPGLYAAGRSTNGVSARYYNSGTSLGDCLFFGRAAGRDAVRQQGWS